MARCLLFFSSSLFPIVQITWQFGLRCENFPRPCFAGYYISNGKKVLITTANWNHIISEIDWFRFFFSYRSMCPMINYHHRFSRCEQTIAFNDYLQRILNKFFSMCINKIKSECMVAVLNRLNRSLPYSNDAYLSRFSVRSSLRRYLSFWKCQYK